MPQTGSRRSPLPALLLAALACGEDPTGLGDFDPATSDEQAQAMLSTIGASPAVQSIGVLADAFVIPVAVAVVSSTLPFAPNLDVPGTWVAPRMARLGRSGASFSQSSGAAIFPTDALGTTYIYNAQTATYEASSLTGAPDDGIRFILYAVDPALSRVISPLEEIGHLDLIDRSTTSENIVGVLAVIDGETLLEYDASAAFTSTSLSFSAAGYVSDGEARVDFDLFQSLNQDAFEIVYDVTVADRNQRVAIEVTGSFETTQAHILLTIETEGGTIVLDVEGTDSAVTGTITHNGRVAVRISGPGTDPDFTDAGGNPLTPTQLAGVDALFDLDDLFGAFDDLLLPALLMLPTPA